MIENGRLRVERIKAFKALWSPKRFKVFFGGRGSGKSWEFAQALLVMGTMKDIRVLCGRELQKSIQESVHKLLCDTIDRLGIQQNYDITKTSIKGVFNNTEFIFSGIATNITAIKSMEGITHVWLEEAENISDHSWSILIPTFRKSGSEIWVSFNPFDELDSTYQRFVTPYLKQIDSDGMFEDDRHYIRLVNYQDNPHFKATELQAEMEVDRENNHNKYLHIWMGQPNADYEDSVIKPEWVNAAIDSHLKLGFPGAGVKVLGFDPADEGGDSKAIVYRHGSIVHEVKEKTDGDISDGINWAFNEADDRNCTHLVYDGIGIGAAIKERLRHEGASGRIQYEAFIGSQLAHDPDRKYENDRYNKDVFRNQRAQYWWYLRDRFYKTYLAIEKGVYTDPTTLISLSSDVEALPALKSELVRVQRKRGNTQQIQIESKDDMKRRGMPSPNLADALVYAFAVKKINMTGDKEGYNWDIPVNY